MRFSIIIANYNNSTLIGKCLDSIKNQTFSDFECIIIDDASTDNSCEIISPYTIDKRFVLVRKDMNSGVSSTRNIGIEKSSGDYILFVDSDDFVAQDFLEIIDKNLDDNVMALRHTMEKSNEIIDIFKNNMFYNNDIGWGWSWVYNTKIIKENNIRFRNISMCEDTIFALEFLIRCKSYKTIPDCIYKYNAWNPYSLTKKNNRREDYLLLSKCLKDICYDYMDYAPFQLVKNDILRFYVEKSYMRVQLTQQERAEIMEF